MRTSLQILLLIIIAGCSSKPYNNSDAIRLSKLSYMNNVVGMNCDSSSGTTLEKRICLNLEFQKIDSVLNYKFNFLLSEVDSKKKDELMEEQDSWIKLRHEKSKEESAGFRGHTLGIIYLQTMIEMTDSRLRKLELILLDFFSEYNEYWLPKDIDWKFAYDEVKHVDCPLIIRNNKSEWIINYLGSMTLDNDTISVNQEMGFENRCYNLGTFSEENIKYFYTRNRMKKKFEVIDDDYIELGGRQYVRTTLPIRNGLRCKCEN